jgi:hypothetical protein
MPDNENSLLENTSSQTTNQLTLTEDQRNERRYENDQRRCHLCIEQLPLV